MTKNFHQLDQLKRLDPASAARAEALIAAYPASASIVIRNAMQAVFTRLTRPAFPQATTTDELYGQVATWIEAQPTILPKQEIAIGCYYGQPIKVCRLANDDLRLRIGDGLNSVYVGYWGRDGSRLSSAYAGKWKVASQAKENIEGMLKKITNQEPKQ